jgi:hypothetical protein
MFSMTRPMHARFPGTITSRQRSRKNCGKSRGNAQKVTLSGIRNPTQRKNLHLAGTGRCWRNIFLLFPEIFLNFFAVRIHFTDSGISGTGTILLPGHTERSFHRSLSVGSLPETPKKYQIPSVVPFHLSPSWLAAHPAGEFRGGQVTGNPEYPELSTGKTLSPEEKTPPVKVTGGMSGSPLLQLQLVNKDPRVIRMAAINRDPFFPR